MAEIGRRGFLKIALPAIGAAACRPLNYLSQLEKSIDMDVVSVGTYNGYEFFVKTDDRIYQARSITASDADTGTNKLISRAYQESGIISDHEVKYVEDLFSTINGNKHIFGIPSPEAENGARIPSTIKHYTLERTPTPFVVPGTKYWVPFLTDYTSLEHVLLSKSIQSSR